MIHTPLLTVCSPKDKHSIQRTQMILSEKNVLEGHYQSPDMPLSLTQHATSNRLIHAISPLLAIRSLSKFCEEAVHKLIQYYYVYQRSQLLVPFIHKHLHPGGEKHGNWESHSLTCQAKHLQGGGECLVIVDTFLWHEEIKKCNNIVMRKKHTILLYYDRCSARNDCELSVLLFRDC